MLDDVYGNASLRHIPGSANCDILRGERGRLLQLARSLPNVCSNRYLRNFHQIMLVLRIILIF